MYYPDMKDYITFLFSLLGEFTETEHLFHLYNTKVGTIRIQFGLNFQREKDFSTRFRLQGTY